MLNTLQDMLKNSRIASAIEKVEAGEEVDWYRLGQLQTLDLARVGELFLLEQLIREDAADGGHYSILEPQMPIPSELL